MILVTMSIPITTQAALKHFSIVDPIMAELLRRALADKIPLTIPVPKKPEEYFARVVQSIVSQQISVKAAASVFGKIAALLENEITPTTILSVPEEVLKACGLSGQKTKYIRHNAVIWHELPITAFDQMTDVEIIAELTKLYGIGRWTAEMFLLFSLARPDVFSFGDLALMQGIYRHYQIKPHHVRKVAHLVESWSPHRSLASLALWWNKDTTPI
jgi:DNA-3-methyladenine glycosylase II